MKTFKNLLPRYVEKNDSDFLAFEWYRKMASPHCSNASEKLDP